MAGRGRVTTGGTLSVGARRILHRTGDAARAGGARRTCLRTAFAPRLAKRRQPPHVGPSTFRTGSRSRCGTAPYEAAHGKVYFLPAFLSVENAMLAKPMPEDRSNLPRRAAGDRE